MIAFLPVSFIFSTLSVGQGFLGPTYVKKYEFKNLIIYQYEYSCFPPDNACECKDYYSLLYFKYSYFPAMHLKKKVDFYIESINCTGDKLVIKASGVCKKDINKKIII